MSLVAYASSGSDEESEEENTAPSVPAAVRTENKAPVATTKAESQSAGLSSGVDHISDEEDDYMQASSSATVAASGMCNRQAVCLRIYSIVYIHVH